MQFPRHHGKCITTSTVLCQQPWVVKSKVLAWPTCCEQQISAGTARPERVSLRAPRSPWRPTAAGCCPSRWKPSPPSSPWPWGSKKVFHSQRANSSSIPYPIIAFSFCPTEMAPLTGSPTAGQGKEMRGSIKAFMFWRNSIKTGIWLNWGQLQLNSWLDWRVGVLWSRLLAPALPWAC